MLNGLNVLFFITQVHHCFEVLRAHQPSSVKQGILEIPLSKVCFGVFLSYPSCMQLSDMPAGATACRFILLDSD